MHIYVCRATLATCTSIYVSRIHVRGHVFPSSSSAGASHEAADRIERRDEHDGIEHELYEASSLSSSPSLSAPPTLAAAAAPFQELLRHPFGRQSRCAMKHRRRHPTFSRLSSRPYPRACVDGLRQSHRGHDGRTRRLAAMAGATATRRQHLQARGALIIDTLSRVGQTAGRASVAK